MKATYLIILRTLIFLSFIPNLLAQDTVDDKPNWFERNNISVRRAFDGSMNENKPATLSLFQNHKSDNDFFNIDIAVKISQWEPLSNTGSILSIYPVVEWHKSTNEEDEKDKLSLGLNGEFYFGSAQKIKPYLLSNFALKRNLMESVNELKYTAQLSLTGAGSTDGKLPGVSWRFNDDARNFKGMYYPYIGYEYNEIPNLMTDGATAFFSTWFARLFVEYWMFPRELQFVLNGTYRRLIKETNGLDSSLPLLNLSMNYYPGKQESISIGLDYRNGKDPESKFMDIETTSLNLKVKF